MSQTYTSTFTFTATLRGEAVRVVSKPGLADGSEVGDPAVLAAQLVMPADGERVLLLGCSHGALAVALARQLPHGQLTLHDPSLIALRMATLTLAANGVPTARVSDRVSQLPDEAGAFDRVLILAPQSRALGRRWLTEAHALLRPGGTLNLAGAKGAGVQPLIDDAAALFGAAHTLGYGRGCRVAEAIRSSEPPVTPAWTTIPGIAPATWHHLRAELVPDSVELVSLPGVFSYDRLDAGTALLLHYAPLEPGLRVLDAGCGYGALGVAAARRGAARVDMFDSNLLAIAAARANMARLDLAHTTATPSDALEAAAGRGYDLVLSNPPFHAGKLVDTTIADAFIVQARTLLAPRGRLLLVANSFLPYERTLAAHFDQTQTVARTKAYKVLEAGSR